MKGLGVHAETFNKKSIFKISFVQAKEMKEPGVQAETFNSKNENFLYFFRT